MVDPAHRVGAHASVLRLWVVSPDNRGMVPELFRLSQGTVYQLDVIIINADDQHGRMKAPGGGEAHGCFLLCRDEGSLRRLQTTPNVLQVEGGLPGFEEYPTCLFVGSVVGLIRHLMNGGLEPTRIDIQFQHSLKKLESGERILPTEATE